MVVVSDASGVPLRQSAQRHQTNGDDSEDYRFRNGRHKSGWQYQSKKEYPGLGWARLAGGSGGTSPTSNRQPRNALTVLWQATCKRPQLSGAGGDDRHHTGGEQKIDFSIERR